MLRLFVGCAAGFRRKIIAFERKLYVIPQARLYRDSHLDDGRCGRCGTSLEPVAIARSSTKACCCPISSRTFFPDLHESALESALALVHSRFSTNTFPTWELAHPYRYVAHNGEINTLRGNMNWMHAREALFASELFGDDLQKILPIINATAATQRRSTTSLELLVLSGPLAARTP